MKVIVKTQSGSIYIFMSKGKEVRVIRNYTQEGIMAEEVEIEMGKPVEIKAYMLNAYNYNQEADVSYWRSNPVVKVTISEG